MTPDRPSQQTIEDTAASGNRSKAEGQKAGSRKKWKGHHLAEDGGDGSETRPRVNKPKGTIVRRERSTRTNQQGSLFNSPVTLGPGATLHQGNVINNQTDEPPACLAALWTTDPRHDKVRIEGDKGGLLADVYQWVLGNDEFLRWRHYNQNRLLWIKGDPGKGKTMLLCGIINELEKEDCLLSYFFCQATDTRINSATAVLRGLIYMLVNQQPSLLSHVQKRYDHADRRLFEDVNAWVAVREIFLDILCDLAPQPPYLVVDALDECQAGRSQLLDLIAGSAASRAKWLVSSRDWPEIEERLAQAERKIPLSLELNAASVSAAVRLYVQKKALALAARKHYDMQTTTQVTEYLSSNAQGTFLWVALVCQSLKDVHCCDVIETLGDFPPGLDALYGRMMQIICGFKKPKAVTRCFQILSTASAVYQPLTLEELRSFVDNPPDKPLSNNALEYYIRLCGSFLAIRDGTVHFVHKSAKDFLCNPSLNANFYKVFPCTIDGVHHALFSKSLQLLSRTLQHDIYRLIHPGTLVENATPPSPDPLGPARYSCVYWVDHLLDAQAKSTDDLQNGGTVHSFLYEKYLNWLEALSLARALPKGVLAVGKLQGLFQGPAEGSHLGHLIRDMQRFILFHRFAIENTPLQTYASALIFSPIQSLTRQLYKMEEPKWLINKPIMEQNWSACFTTLQGHSDWVRSVAFSHDGRQLASASVDRTVKLWDAATGTCAATLKGHSGEIRSVAFSHDGQQLASASADRTVKLWDAATGACFQTVFVGATLYNISFDTAGSCLYTDTGTILIDKPPTANAPPRLQKVGISSDRKWITWNGQNLLWLPHEYQPLKSAVTRSTVAFNCSSGRVLLFGILGEKVLFR